METLIEPGRFHLSEVFVQNPGTFSPRIVSLVALSSELVAPHRTLPARELRVDLFLWSLDLAGIKGKSDR